MMSFADMAISGDGGSCQDLARAAAEDTDAEPSVIFPETQLMARLLCGTVPPSDSESPEEQQGGGPTLLARAMQAGELALGLLLGPGFVVMYRVHRLDARQCTAVHRLRLLAGGCLAVRGVRWHGPRAASPRRGAGATRGRDGAHQRRRRELAAALAPWARAGGGE